MTPCQRGYLWLTHTGPWKVLSAAFDLLKVGDSPFRFWKRNWITLQLTNWLNSSHMSEWLAGWLAEWLTGWLADRPTDWLTDWVAEWLADWLTDWPADYISVILETLHCLCYVFYTELFDSLLECRFWIERFRGLILAATANIENTSMLYGSSREANSHSDSHEMPNLFWKTKVHYSVQKSQPDWLTDWLIISC